MIRAAPPKVDEIGRGAEQHPAQGRGDQQLDIGHRRHHRRRRAHRRHVDEQMRERRRAGDDQAFDDDARRRRRHLELGAPRSASRLAATTSIGAAIIASRNCIAIGEAAPAALRLQIISQAMPPPRRADRKRARPSASTLGRSTTSTPAKASSGRAPHRLRRLFAEHQRREHAGDHRAGELDRGRVGERHRHHAEEEADGGERSPPRRGRAAARASARESPCAPRSAPRRSPGPTAPAL